MPRVSRLGVGGGLNHLCEVEVPEMFGEITVVPDAFDPFMAPLQNKNKRELIRYDSAFFVNQE